MERNTRLAVTQLKRFRNNSIVVPMNRLPHELLHMILSYVRHPPSSRSSGQLSAYKFGSYHNLVSAMLVCHKWYDIGSQAASLWTDIDFARQGAFAPVLLNRSLGAPICLCGRLDDDVLSTVIADHGERIRELDLWAGANVFYLMPVLQSILAANMSRLRVLSLSREGSDFEDGIPLIAQPSDAPVSFSSLRAMLLESLLFIPAYPLPQLTHLYLSGLDEVDPSSILSLLRHTPTLEVFDIKECRECTSAPQSGATRCSSVMLRCLRSVFILSLTTTTVHDLMTRLEVPNLTSLRLSSIFAKDGALWSTTLIPGSLTTRTINRVAFNLDGEFATFQAALFGRDLSLSMDICALGVENIAEAERWAFDDFPKILRLSGVIELHFQAEIWPGIGEDHLLLLAAYMPAVSTLCIKHYQHPDDSGTEGLMDLARVLVAILENDWDRPVLFPRLAHLELIVSDIPWEFCEILAPALAHRARQGRRLRRLRILLDDAHWDRWSRRSTDSMDLVELDYRETGIRENVTYVTIGEKTRGFSNTLGWGCWRDCVMPARHSYW